jgi:hypothetical protein
MKNLYQTQIKLIAALIFLNIGLVAAQGPLQWSNGFTRGSQFSGNNDIINDIAALSTGSTISVGETPNAAGIEFGDVAAIKYSPSGQLLNTYFLDFYGTDYGDKAVKVIVREPYVYILATVTLFTTSFGTEGDIGIIKLDTSLNFISKSFVNSPIGIEEEAIDMGMDAYNNIYVVGSSERGGTTGTDIVFVKFDQNLIRLFEKYNTSTGVFTDVPSAIKVQPNGVCNIVGTKTSATKGLQAATMKYWGNGVLLWQKTYDVAGTTNFSDEGKAITVDPITDDVYVAGVGQAISGDNDWIVLKYNGTTGALSWAKRYTGVATGDDRGVDISFFNSTALYVCGNIKTTFGGATSNNIQLRKLNPSTGATLWNKTYDGLNNSNYDRAFSMVVTPNEFIYTLGTTEESTVSSTTVFHLVQCYKSTGLLQWTDLVSTNTTSIFQQMDAIKGAYNLSTQSFHVATRKLTNIGVVRSWVTTKYGPTSLFQNPSEVLAERLGLNSDDFGIKIFPNPFIENFTITNETNSRAIIEIYNLEGKLILRKENSFLQNEISTEGWAIGTYLVKIIGENNAVSRRILKY